MRTDKGVKNVASFVDYIIESKLPPLLVSLTSFLLKFYICSTLGVFSLFCFVPFENLQEKDNRYHTASLVRKPEPKPWSEDFPSVHLPPLPGGCYCAGLFGSHWAFTESIRRHLALCSLHIYPKSLPVASLILSHSTTFCRKVCFSDSNVIVSSHFVFSGTYTSTVLIAENCSGLRQTHDGLLSPLHRRDFLFHFCYLGIKSLPRTCFNSVSL